MSARAYVLVWRFEVAPDRRAEFKRRYGPDGDWARLFARHAGHLGTQLLHDPEAPGVYLTLDRWRGVADWQAFRHDYSAQYVALDAACEALTLGELRVGAFDEIE